MQARPHGIYKTLHDKFAKLLRGPDAETGGDGAFDAITDGDDGVEVVEIGAVVLAVGGSSKEIRVFTESSG